MENEVRRELLIDAKGKRRGYKLWIVCPVCNEGRWVREGYSKRTYFTGMCIKCHPKFTTGRDESHSTWKGGRKLKEGYVLIRLKPDDFFYSMANPKYPYVLEHRLVMARHLNRCLLPWEVVHHKNGIKDDNRIENLQLFPSVSYHIIDATMKSLVGRLKKTITKQQKIIDKLTDRLNGKFDV